MSHVRPNNELRTYRNRRKLRLRDVALLVGQREAAHVTHWEKGTRVPSLDNALRLSAALKCPVEILFFDRFNQLRHSVYEQGNKHDIRLSYD